MPSMSGLRSTEAYDSREESSLSACSVIHANTTAEYPMRVMCWKRSCRR